MVRYKQFLIFHFKDSQKPYRIELNKVEMKNILGRKILPTGQLSNKVNQILIKHEKQSIQDKIINVDNIDFMVFEKSWWYNDWFKVHFKTFRLKEYQNHDYIAQINSVLSILRKE